MKLGLLTAAFPDLTLEEVAEWASGEGFQALEIACWPSGGSERRRYAGVTHIDVESFLGTAAGALYADEKLMEAAAASPDSLITALMRCAAKGHQPGTEEFYLIPRRIKGVPTVQGIEGYRGIVERMYRSGGVASVDGARVVIIAAVAALHDRDAVDAAVHPVRGARVTAGREQRTSRDCSRDYSKERYCPRTHHHHWDISPGAVSGWRRWANITFV